MTDWRNVTLLGVAVLVGVLLFEVVVRLARIDANLSPNWRYHPILGWSQVPNGTYDFGLHGRPIHVRFNALGFRDRDHEQAKPPGTRRVVVIGDSFCEAIQVNLEETFHQTLERLLNDLGTARWEVINLGVGDFGTAQAYIALTEYGLAFQPDVIIHQVFPLNDICNNSLALYGLCRSENDRYRPYFVESGSGLRLTTAQPVRNFLRRHVVTYRVLEFWTLRRFAPDPEDREDARRNRRLEARGFEGRDPLFLTLVAGREQPEEVAEGWRVTDKLIERVVGTARERGIAYVGLVAPFAPGLSPGWPEVARALPPPPVDPGYAERRLALHFGGLGVPAVMLMEEFQPFLDEVLPFLDGHLNAAGHRRAAEALCRQFVASSIAAVDADAGEGGPRFCEVPPPPSVAAARPAGDVTLPLLVDVGDSTARPWMGTGWHWDEADGGHTYVWSDRSRSTLAIPLPAHGDVRMDFEVLPFAYRGSPPQHVTLVVNDRVIADVQLRSGLRRYGVTLPAAALAEPLDTLEFRYTWARAPREVLRNSADTRVLAVAWYTITFTPVRP
jgi:hypothetical protein